MEKWDAGDKKWEKGWQVRTTTITIAVGVSGRRNFIRSYTMFTNFETFLQWSSDVKIIENIKNIREEILWARKYFSALSLGVKFQVSILPTAKSFSPSGTRAFLETSPSPPRRGRGGGGVSRRVCVDFLKFSRVYFVIIIFSLVWEERVSKQLKQFSIVGRLSSVHGGHDHTLTCDRYLQTKV